MLSDVLPEENRGFSTRDRDNDESITSNCAEKLKGKNNIYLNY